MSNLLKSKFLFGVVAFATVAIVAGVLMMTAATSASAAYMHTVTLKQGSTGAQVMELQKTLNMTTCKVATAGVGSPGMESSYFGSLTKGAVMCFQALKGLVADGIVGPMTGGALAGVSPSGNFPAGCTSAAGYSPTTGVKCDSAPSTGLPAGCTSTTGYSTTTGKPCNSTTGPSTGGPLTGGAGSVSSWDLTATNNEEVGEDEEDVEIYGLEIEADEGSDLEITAVRLDFNQGTADNDDLQDYVSEVSIWLDGEEFARLDADEFDEDDGWEKTVTLDSGAVVKAGETAELTVAVSGVANIDSNDDGETWTVDAETVRYVDAQGASTTEDPGTGTRSFTVELFATAADTELKISLSDEDEINEAHVINIAASDFTSNVPVLSFEAEVEGDSDLAVDDIVVEFTVANAGDDDLDDIATEVRLLMDGEEVGSENVPTDDGTVTFDDLDLTLEAGETYVFEVQVELEDMDDANVAPGDTIMAVVTDTETDLWDVEDEAGEELADADKTGTASGEAHAAYDSGIMVEFDSASAEVVSAADAAGESDVAEFKIKFDVTAFDADMQIDRTCANNENQGDAGEGLSYLLNISAADTTGWTISCNIARISGETTEDAATIYEIDEDDTDTFELSVSVTPDEDSFAQLAIEAINWATSATADASSDQFYTFNLSDFTTSSIFLNDM